MIATFPFIWLCNKHGAKMTFFVSGIVSAISCALIPAAASLGYTWLLIIRVFQGLAYACDFAVIGVLVTRWAGLSENAKFIALMTCFSPLANGFTNGISGWICDSSLGWTYVHYVHAIFSVVLFTLWFILYNDDPRSNRFVSSIELFAIQEGKTEAHKSHTSFVPYKVGLLKETQLKSIISGNLY
jgi:MFS family permease